MQEQISPQARRSTKSHHVTQADIPVLRMMDVSKPYVGPARISPAAAREWLLEHVDYRPMRHGMVDYIYRQIEAGEWQSDHPQPIVWSAAGKLLDGKHRMAAIARGTKTVTASVACGAREALRQYIDTGRSRSLAERLAFSDHPGLNQAIGSLIGVMRQVHGQASARLSPSEGRSIFEANRNSLEFAGRYLARKHKLVSRPPVMIALAEMYDRDKQSAANFGDSLMTPDGHVQQARILRDYLLQLHDRGKFAEYVETYGRSVHAMKAAIAGKTIKQLRVARWD